MLHLNKRYCGFGQHTKSERERERERESEREEGEERFPWFQNINIHFLDIFPYSNLSKKKKKKISFLINVAI